MEVSKSEWKEMARENMERYLNRGGEGKGDDPQYLGGTALLNTIGVAMSLPMCDPSKWSKTEMEAAVKGDLCYFKGKEREVIDMIDGKIRSNCGNDSTNYVTVLPIELYFEGKLFEIPLFRFKRYEGDKIWNFLDNVGRVYDSISDWEEHNRLPPCQIAYPKNGHLTSTTSGQMNCVFDDSWADKPMATVTKVADIGIGIAGLLCGVGAIFITGGLAAPLVAGGIGAAIYGTSRSTYQLADRGGHDESINPFTDSQSRLLWLGIAANCLSFGAMGATARLGALAARGSQISTGFRIFVNAINGTSLTFSTMAIIDSTVYMVMHIEKMSPADCLLQLAAIAFWTKGVFQYKTAGGLIREVQGNALNKIGSQLSPERQEAFKKLRGTDFGNDRDLLRAFHWTTKNSKVPPSRVANIMLEINEYIQTNSKVGQPGSTTGDSLPIFNLRDGSLKIGIHTLPIEFLDSLPSPSSRQTVLRTLGGLSGVDGESFSELRSMVNNDLHLFSAIYETSVQNNLTPQQATQTFIRLFNELSTVTTRNFKHSSGSLVRMPSIKFGEGGVGSTEAGQVVIGHGQVYTVQKLNSLSPQALRSLALLAHLERTEAGVLNRFRHWIQNDELVLTWICPLEHVDRHLLMATLEVQKKWGIFEGGASQYSAGLVKLMPCKEGGRGILLMDQKLRVSVFKFATFPWDEEGRSKFWSLLKKVPTPEAATPPNQISLASGEARKLFSTQLRLRFEFQRTNVVNWFHTSTRDQGLTLRADMMPNEKDRLYTIKSTMIEKYRGPTAIDRPDNPIIRFAVSMEPRNVSEFASYFEYAMEQRHILGAQVKEEVAEFNRQNPKNPIKSKNKTAYVEGETDRRMVEQFDRMREEFDWYRRMARRGDMVGVHEVDQNFYAGGVLSDHQLVQVIYQIEVKISSEISAAYHIHKHFRHDPIEYVRDANRFIRGFSGGETLPDITLTQEGDARIISFVKEATTDASGGKAVLFERDGRIFLLSYVFTRQKAAGGG